LANLRAGCDALERDGVRIDARSHVYETEAMEGAVGQADFLNACVECETGLSPEELLASAKRIELELGRDPDAPRHSSRPLDIDVLLLSDPERIDLPAYRVPHPGMMERRFVLEPLLELDPPDRGELERVWAAASVQSQRIEKLPIIL
jgi:2-amino-4-hydroxy-6-hydroxymethyldihydropteridine diphosphokinase